MEVSSDRFTLFKNATIISIEYLINYKNSTIKEFILNSFNLLRNIIEENNEKDEEYVKTAKLIYSALLIDYNIDFFDIKTIVNFSVIDNVNLVIKEFLNNKAPVNSYLRYDNTGMIINKDTLKMLNVSIDFTSPLIYIIKSRRKLYSLVLPDETTFFLTIYRNNVSIKLINKEYDIDIFEFLPGLDYIISNRVDISSIDKSMIITGVQMLNEYKLNFVLGTKCVYDYPFPSLFPYLNLSCHFTNKIDLFNNYFGNYSSIDSALTFINQSYKTENRYNLTQPNYQNILNYQAHLETNEKLSILKRELVAMYNNLLQDSKFPNSNGTYQLLNLAFLIYLIIL